MTRRPFRAPFPFADLLGLGVERGEDGQVWIVCDAGPRHHNPNGVVHGGLAYALLDTAMGDAIERALGGGTWSTIELKLNYTRSARDGTLRACARLVHQGRRTMVLEGEVRRGDGQTVAIGLGTFLVESKDP